MAFGGLYHLRERSRLLIGHLRAIASSAPPTQLLPVGFAASCSRLQYWFLSEQWHDYIRQREKRDCTAFKLFLREDTGKPLQVSEHLGRDVTVSWHWRCVFVAFVVFVVRTSLKLQLRNSDIPCLGSYTVFLLPQ